VGKPRGVYGPAFKPFQTLGKLTEETPRVSPDAGNLAVRDYRGASGNMEPWWDCEPVLQPKERATEPPTCSGVRPISIPIVRCVRRGGGWKRGKVEMV
jgi:hypothetical protein